LEGHSLCGARSEKILIHSVSGFAEPGSMTALMGASAGQYAATTSQVRSLTCICAAGKTTLLDVIAGRKSGRRLSGEIYLNGCMRERCSFARLTAYCEQVDIHSPYSTVQARRVTAARVESPCSFLSRRRLYIFLLRCVSHQTSRQRSAACFVSGLFALVLFLRALWRCSLRYIVLQKSWSFFGLTAFEDRMVGTADDAGGISPCQRKILSIGVKARI